MRVSHRDGGWPHRVELPVLGVPVEFFTDSPDALAAIRSHYGGWTDVPAAARSGRSRRPVVRIFAAAARGGDVAPSGFAYRVPHATRMTMTSESGFGVADSARLDSIGYAAPALLSRPAAFAEGLLDPLTLFPLAACDRQPLHAAAVARDGVAMVLEGPSGVGKSTLTYAASRRGFRPLADEAVYVQIEPVVRIWGRRSRIQLRPEARAHFPALAGVPATEVAAGKERIVVPPDERDPRFAERVGVCLLERGARAGLERASPARVREAVARHMTEGFDLYAATVPDRAALLAARGAWVLTLSGDPAEGAALVEEAAGELGRG